MFDTLRLAAAAGLNFQPPTAKQASWWLVGCNNAAQQKKIVIQLRVYGLCNKILHYFMKCYARLHSEICSPSQQKIYLTEMSISYRRLSIQDFTCLIAERAKLSALSVSARFESRRFQFFCVYVSNLI